MRTGSALTLIYKSRGNLIGFKGLLSGCDVHFHIDRLHHSQAGRGQGIVGWEEVAIQHRAFFDPVELNFTAIPEVLVGVDDGRKFGLGLCMAGKCHC